MDTQTFVKEIIGEDLDLCPEIANILDDFPNVQAIVRGTIAGEFREWPLVRRELRKMLNKISERINDIHYDSLLSR